MSARSRALIAVLALGCGGKPVKPATHAESSLLSRIVVAPSYSTPAVYRYHPSRQAPVQAERRLSDGQSLLVGDRGERWLLDPKTHTLTAGPSLAPENLIAVLEVADRFWFVGQSGTNYEARGPLGKFLRSSAPLEPLVRVSASGQTIIGIPADGSLSRSVDGAASFSRVGPAGITFADIELANDGSGLALAIPEALWFSRDEGATWAAVPGQTEGAFALTRSRAGRVQIESLLGPYRFRDQPPRLEAGAEADTKLVQSAEQPPRGPDANALAEGRAFVDGARYFEISASPAHPSDYELWQGALDEKLVAQAVPELRGCRGARLAGFENFLELACFRGPSDSGSVPVAFFRSASASAQFAPEPFAAFGNAESFRFAMGERGELVASGLCARPGAGCSPGGILVRRATRAAPSTGARPPKPRATPPNFELFAAATPSLVESALGLAFSLDGRSAYAVGRRSKTGRLALFVSHDGGESFEVRELSLVRADADDEDRDYDRSQSSARLESLAAAEDGSLALVIADRHGRELLLVDEQGRMISSSKPPDERALVSAVGPRAFALTPNSRKAWESLDGGVSWHALGPFPVTLCSSEGDCNLKLRCAPLGCFIGSEVSRLGWAGQADDDLDSLPPAGVTPMPLTERKLGPSLSCSADETTWQTLPGVRELPSSRDAALGKTSFVAIATDAAHASASAVHGFGGSHPHLETVSLLSPLSARAVGYAFEVLDQVEGAAALRYRTPEDPAKDSHLRNIEVAWDNALSGQVGKARLSDGGAALPGDYESGELVQHAVPDLLSIGEGGLYLRLHHNLGDDQETIYFDGQRSARIPPVKWPFGKIAGRTEMAENDHQHVPLMLFGHGTAVARARVEGGHFVFDAQTIALPNPSAFGQVLSSNVAYLGDESGMYVQTQSLLGAPASALFFAFRASGEVLGAPVRVPTQANLADRPSYCTSSDLRATPRIDASYLPGTRRAIVVADNSDAPRVFLTSGAVLFGTPEHACARAFDAEEVVLDTTPARHERIILLLDDLEHTWLFRTIHDPSGAPAVQYRTLKCHYDPSVELPVEVYRAPGTQIAHGG
jgi:hypothetical protein